MCQFQRRNLIELEIMSFNEKNAQNERRHMAQQRCKKCGNWFSEEGSEPKVCSACSPKTESTEGQSALKVSSESVKVSDSAPSESTVNQDDSSGKAISILEFVNTVNAICGVIIVIGCLVLGFATDQVAIGVGAALAWSLVTIIVWAVDKVFIGIAKDVRTIRQITQRDS